MSRIHHLFRGAGGRQGGEEEGSHSLHEYVYINMYRSLGEESRCCALSRDGGVALVGQEDGGVRVLNLETGEGVLLAGHEEGGVRQVALSADGSVGASAGGDGRVIAWNVRDAQEIVKIRADGYRFAHGVALSADGMTLFASFAAAREERGIVLKWDLATRCHSMLRMYSCKIYALCTSYDAQRVAVTRASGVVEVVDVKSKSIIQLFGHTRGEVSVAMDAFGKRVLVANKHARVHGVSPERFTCSAVRYRANAKMPGCAMSADASRFVSLERNGLKVRDGNTGFELLALACRAKVYACCMSADGGTIAAVTSDKQLAIWQLPGLPNIPVPYGSVCTDLENIKSGQEARDASGQCALSSRRPREGGDDCGQGEPRRQSFSSLPVREDSSPSGSSGSFARQYSVPLPDVRVRADRGRGELYPAEQTHSPRRPMSKAKIKARPKMAERATSFAQKEVARRDVEPVSSSTASKREQAKLWLNFASGDPVTMLRPTETAGLAPVCSY